MADENRKQPEVALAEVALEFMRAIPMPAFLADEEREIYLANQAMADAFGYESLEALENSLRRPSFLAGHFPPDAVALLYEMLHEKGRVEGWIIRGQSLDGREITFEINARARLRSAQGPAHYFEAILVEPGNARDAEAFLSKARKEAELAANAKTEFLSNISHELRTPLNIIVGMLGLAVEDQSIDGEMRHNLTLAKEAADGLAMVLNDLIVLSNLEARRLTSDISAFSPGILLKDLAHQFTARAQEKNIRLAVMEGQEAETIVEGGYNLIILAMKKLVDNAIKFTEPGGEVCLTATLEVRDDGPLLFCRILDNGPGFPPGILNSDELFIQGDGSKNRKYGGLGLGLSITGNILATLGGRLECLSPESGGTELHFRLPVKYTEMREIDTAE